MGSKNAIGKLVNTIFRLFVCRTDMCGIQRNNDGQIGYRVVQREVNRKLIRRHIKGEITIGVFPSPPGRCRWLCFDFDQMNMQPAGRLREVFRRHGGEGYVEFSGCKGYHLWIFFGQMQPNRLIRKVGRAALREAQLEDVELFPAQDKVSQDRPGNLIKLPMGVHRATGNRCLFVDESGEPVEHQLELLRSVHRADADELADGFDLESEAGTTRRSNADLDTPAQLKPCVENLIREGVSEGYRNQANVLVASDLRRSRPGIPKTTVGGVLSAFNLRCEPPLRRDEVQRVLDSAFRPETPYEYGCNWGGPPLSELVEEFCVGRENCIYLDLLKNLTEGDVKNARTSRKGGD